MHMNNKLLKIKKRIALIPSYTLVEDSVFEKKIKKAKKILNSCTLCPNECKVNRLRGEIGLCGQGKYAKISHFLPHFGEEPPLSGINGAGTVFFSGCTLSCIYCQNYQISSPEGIGKILPPNELAAIFVRLSELNCHNIDLVSPTPHISAILESLYIVKKQGIKLPIIYNTNGYLSETTLSLLEDIVDIYLPDIKYSDDTNAFKYSKIKNYVKHSKNAVAEMLRQRKELLVDENGIAYKGCVIRILLLPSELDGMEKTLEFLAEHKGINISIMTQYSPLNQAHKFPEISKKISRDYIDKIFKLADSYNFDNIFTQGIESQNIFIPDFERDSPFD